MEIDFDLLFYLYVCKMGMSEHDFWKSPLRKILKMIDMYQDDVAVQNAAFNQNTYESKYFEGGQREISDIRSMKEIEGWE